MSHRTVIRAALSIVAAGLAAIVLLGTAPAMSTVVIPAGSPQRVYGPASSEMYAYAPSAVTDAGSTYYYTCHNDVPGQIRDHVYFSQVDAPGAPPAQDRSVLAGSAGWDSKPRLRPERRGRAGDLRGHHVLARHVLPGHRPRELPQPDRGRLLELVRRPVGQVPAAAGHDAVRRSERLGRRDAERDDRRLRVGPGAAVLWRRREQQRQRYASAVRPVPRPRLLPRSDAREHGCPADRPGRTAAHGGADGHGWRSRHPAQLRRRLRAEP